MKDEHGEKIKALGKEITLADAAGYKRGIDEMMAKTTGGENVDENADVAINPFAAETTGPPIVPGGAVEEITERLNAALNYIDRDRLVVAPDCGLGLLPAQLAEKKLKAMCKAAALV